MSSLDQVFSVLFSYVCLIPVGVIIQIYLICVIIHLIMSVCLSVCSVSLCLCLFLSLSLPLIYFPHFFMMGLNGTTATFFIGFVVIEQGDCGLFVFFLKCVCVVGGWGGGGGGGWREILSSLRIPLS